MASVLALPRTTVRASRDDLIQRAGILLLVLWLCLLLGWVGKPCSQRLRPLKPSSQPIFSS